MYGQSQIFSPSKAPTPPKSLQVNELVLGYMSSPKKKQAFFADLELAASTWTGTFGPDGPVISVRIIHLCDDFADNEQSGPVLHAILHKCTDDMVAAVSFSNRVAAMHVSRLAQLLGKYRFTPAPFMNSTAVNTRRSFPVVAVDPLDCVWKLVDRRLIYESVDQIFGRNSAGQFSTNYEKVGILPWVLLNVKQSDEDIRARLQDVLKFPVIIKRRPACGSTKSHDMVIAYDIGGAIASMRFVFSFKDPEQGDEDALGEFYPNFISGFPHPGEDFANEVIAQEFISDHRGIFSNSMQSGVKYQYSPA